MRNMSEGRAVEEVVTWFASSDEIGLVLIRQARAHFQLRRSKYPLHYKCSTGTIVSSANTWDATHFLFFDRPSIVEGHCVWMCCKSWNQKLLRSTIHYEHIIRSTSVSKKA